MEAREDKRPHVRHGLVQLVAVVVLLAASLAAVAYGASRSSGGANASPAARAAATTVGGAPFAVGDGAANVALDHGDEAVLVRWVARETDVVERLYLRVKVEGSSGCPYSGRRGYADGDSGVLQATTHPTRADGTPDVRVVLHEERFRPCGREEGESVHLTLDLPVSAGEEFATVVRNVAPEPEEDFFSLNFLFLEGGVKGANGRNERRRVVADSLYGLDPRELVGYSTDGGSSWDLPGGPYGARRGGSFMPTVIQVYRGGARTGQPYYRTTQLSGDVTMVFPDVAAPWRITHLAAYTSRSSEGTVRLWVDGRERAAVRLAGRGRLSARIDPVMVPAGATVEVGARAGDGGLALVALGADAEWRRVMGLGIGFAYHQLLDPPNPASIFPLPGPPTEAIGQVSATCGQVRLVSRAPRRALPARLRVEVVPRLTGSLRMSAVVDGRSARLAGVPRVLARAVARSNACASQRVDLRLPAAARGSLARLGSGRVLLVSEERGEDGSRRRTSRHVLQRER